MSEIRASEGQHWYYPDGSPCYEITGKNGKVRPPTLREAKTMGLLPGTTTIIGQADAPGLTNWKIEQGIMAALTLPRIEGENDEQLMARIKADAQERSLKARERGTLIHKWVEMGFEGKLNPLDEGYPFFMAADDELVPVPWAFLCEKSFAHERFGGKVDLHTPEMVIDIKTTDKPLEGLKLWDNHIMQLAAYKHGLGLPSEARGAILFVHSVVPEARLVFAEEKDLARGLKMFLALVDYYYSKTGL
jgi:hypothetical protein